MTAGFTAVAARKGLPYTAVAARKGLPYTAVAARKGCLHARALHARVYAPIRQRPSHVLHVSMHHPCKSPRIRALRATAPACCETLGWHAPCGCRRRMRRRRLSVEDTGVLQTLAWGSS
jgi:hypothetical protein